MQVVEYFLQRVEDADQTPDYGQMAYDTGLSLHDFSETVNSVLDVQRSWRRFFQKSWDVARSWKRLAPAHSHLPVPVVVLLAMQSVAAAGRSGDGVVASGSSVLSK